MPTRQKLLIIVLLIFSFTSYTLYAYENALEVRTDVPGVSVFIDSEYKGESEPFDSINVFRLDDIEPGQHNLKCKYKDYEPFTDRITIPKEGTTNIEVNFLLKDIEIIDITQKGEGQQLKKTGTIFVRSKPTGANIYLNGQLIMNEDEEIIRTDSKFDKIPIGNIDVKCTFGSDKILKGNFNLADSETVRVMADFFENKMIIKVKEKYNITIASTHDGRIFVNDRYIGSGSRRIKLSEGTYKVLIKKEGCKTIADTITVSEENLYTYKLKFKTDISVSNDLDNPSFDNIVDNWLGVTIKNINPQLKKQFNIIIDEGVVITDIQKNSPASRTDLSIGNVIIEVEKIEINNLLDYRKISKLKAKNQNSLLLYINTGKDLYKFVAIKI